MKIKILWEIKRKREVRCYLIKFGKKMLLLLLLPMLDQNN